MKKNQKNSVFIPPTTKDFGSGILELKKSKVKRTESGLLYVDAMYQKGGENEVK